jgi:hypothetical protein
MEHPGMPGIRFLLAALLVALAGVTAGADSPGEPKPFPDLCTMRVETDLFADASDEPLARSLTLFHEGVAWDFLEEPVKEAAAHGGMRLVEIVLHDPARERIVVIDPARRIKTEIPLIRLERLNVSLARWASESDDRLVRWAGGADVASGIEEADGRLDLSGPRVRYAVRHVDAPSPEAADTYRRFADASILLRALLQPGGLPPFPRLALNARLEDRSAIPAAVTLEIEPRGGLLGGRTERFRSVHRSHPQLIAADFVRLEEARQAVAAAERVGLVSFMTRPGAVREDPESVRPD